MPNIDSIEEKCFDFFLSEQHLGTKLGGLSAAVTAGIVIAVLVVVAAVVGGVIFYMKRNKKFGKIGRSPAGN